MILNMIGVNYIHPKNFSINRPDGSGDYLLLVLKSDSYIVLDYKKINVPKNSVIIFNKNTPQFYGASSEEFVNDWIHFNISDKEKKQIEDIGIEFDTVYTYLNCELFSEFIKNLYFEFNSYNTHKETSINLYFKLLLIKISERINSSFINTENNHYDTLSKLRLEIGLSPNRDWNVQKISKDLGLSRSYIQHLYKDYFNSTITNDISKSRMEYAKYLLTTTDYSVYNISSMCGYLNDVHFMRLFKKSVGLTPTEYRKNSKKSIQKEP